MIEQDREDIGYGAARDLFTGEPPARSLAGGRREGLLSALGTFVGGMAVVSGLVAITYADVMRLMIHTEENTRATAQLLARFMSGQRQ